MPTVVALRMQPLRFRQATLIDARERRPRSQPATPDSVFINCASVSPLYKRIFPKH